MSNPLTLGKHCMAALMQGWILECGAWREAYRIRKKRGKKEEEKGIEKRKKSKPHMGHKGKKGLGDNIQLHWRVRRIKLQSSLLNVGWGKKDSDMNGGGSSVGLWNAKGLCYTTFKGTARYFHVTNKAYCLPGKELGVISYFHKTVTVERKSKKWRKLGCVPMDLTITNNFFPRGERIS